MIQTIHREYVHGRRVEVLKKHLLSVLPAGGRVLDVGCGDGLIDSLLRKERPGLSIEGLDVLIRPETHIPVTYFDGVTLPFGDDSFDVVMFIDVLHHAVDPLGLLREAKRVSRSMIVLKDHLAEGLLARPTLRLMDWVGNAHHGVSLPYNYWALNQWEGAFNQLSLQRIAWREKIGLYPFPANLLFDRRLHFVASLGVG